MYIYIYNVCNVLCKYNMCSPATQQLKIDNEWHPRFFGEAVHEVVKLKFYEADRPEEYTETGGNETCVETLKHLKQGIMPGSAI